MEIRRGDVVLMVVSHDLGRPRPGIVVQADEFNKEFTTIFVCPLTSDISPAFSTRPLIDPAPSNGLQLQSQIMADKMAALQREKIRKVIGRIDAATSELLDRSLLTVLGLGS